MTIPNNIFQILIHSHPELIEEKIKKNLDGWNYITFREYDFINYIKNNSIVNLTNINDNIKLFENISLDCKIDFFKYYYLYLNGGIFMNCDMMIETDINLFINDISSNTEQYYIQSCLNNLIFDGFIATIPNNKYILELIILLYENIISNNGNDFLNIKNKFYKKIIDNNNNQIEYKTNIFYEVINGKYCKIYNKNNLHVLTHYYNSNLNDQNHLYYSLSYDRNFDKLNKNIKIGLTFNIPKRAIDLYCNGLRQNILYLAELLLNIGYQCDFVVFDNEIKNIKQEEINDMMYDNRFKITKVSNIFKENYDIVIIIGMVLNNEIIKLLKWMKTIILGYFCGNSYIIESEVNLYGKSCDINSQHLLSNNEPLYDEIWSIPQMVNTNLHYWKTLYRTNCIEVPFIWSNNANNIISKIEDVSNNHFLYSKKKNNKNIAIFEPNISIMKWCLPCLLVCENTYRKLNNKDLINCIYITNFIKNDNNQINKESFDSLIKTLDIRKDDKCSIEKRFGSLPFLKNYADICVSHTWENGLNYLYLELAWMGWPIVHNGHLCKDVGYYYNEFNYEEGGKILLDVIKNHDKNIEQYIKKNREIIDRYLPTNKELQYKYEILIKQLINSYKYNLNINTNIDYKYLITKKINSVIPLVIYQVWHSDDLPNSVNYSINSIKEYNPEFEHKLFNLDMCREFIKNNFEQRILNAFDNIIPYAFKFDLWRYCILYLNGGIYLDSKYCPLNNFKFYWLTDKEYFCRDIAISRSGLYNALIICKPKNILMLNAIYKVVENVENKFYGSFSLEPTGPLMLKKLAFELDIDINNFELHLEQVDEVIHFIRYKSLRILELHKEYRKEQKNIIKHWSYYWKNKCAYK
jgi:mannosyltransferase OCH1-like enzyme